MLEAEKLCLRTTCMYRISLGLQKPNKNWQSKTNEKPWLNVSHMLTCITYTIRRHCSKIKHPTVLRRLINFHNYFIIRLTDFSLIWVKTDLKAKLSACEVKKANIPRQFFAWTWIIPFNADPRPNIFWGGRFYFHYRFSPCKIIKIQYNVMSSM